MHKEDVKVGLKVLVDGSSFIPTEETISMIGCVTKILKYNASDDIVFLRTPDGDYEGWFRLRDIEPTSLRMRNCPRRGRADPGRLRPWLW